MGMNYMIILAHPDEKSFNSRLFHKIQIDLKAAGHSVYAHDLYRQNFNPVLQNNEITSSFSFDEDVMTLVKELESSQRIIFIYPEWWGSLPGILKGFIDRVFQSGSAYGYTGDIFEEKTKKGYLVGKDFFIYMTTNRVPSFSDDVMDSHLIWWKNSVLDFCGANLKSGRILFDYRHSGTGQKKAWMDQVHSDIFDLS